MRTIIGMINNPCIHDRIIKVTMDIQTQREN